MVIDKLHKGLERNLMEGTYFRYVRERKAEKPSGPQSLDLTGTEMEDLTGTWRIDSSASEKEEALKIMDFNLDSLYNDLPDRLKRQVITQSLNDARASMNYVSSTYLNSDTKISRLFYLLLHRRPPGSHYKERRTGYANGNIHSLFYFLLYHIPFR